MPRRNHAPARHRDRRTRHRVLDLLPARTEAPAFHPQRGGDVLTRYPFLAPGQPLREAADWRGALVGKALPGGTVTGPAYAELAADLLNRLAELGPIDGLWYDIHGAMTVEDLDDAEAELLHRIREVVGPDVLVSTSMDLHGNVSRELVHQSDLITCYRMAPHEDAMETKERAARNLVELLASGAPRPAKAWVPVPVLLVERADLHPDRAREERVRGRRGGGSGRRRDGRGDLGRVRLGGRTAQPGGGRRHRPRRGRRIHAAPSGWRTASGRRGTTSCSSPPPAPWTSASTRLWLPRPPVLHQRHRRQPDRGRRR